jgi:CheY-like chemotaxis protein
MISLPVVMVSASNSTANVVKAIESGCNDWVHKPFDRQELLARVRSQIRHKGLVQDRLGECVHRDTLRAAMPDSVVQQLIDQAEVPKAPPSQRRKQVRRRSGSGAAGGRHGTPQQKGAAEKELAADTAVAAGAAKAELDKLQGNVNLLKKKQLEADRGLTKAQESLDHSQSQKQRLQKEVAELQGQLERARIEKYRSEQSQIPPEVTTVPEAAVPEASSSSRAPEVAAAAGEPATFPAAATLANVTAAVSEALKALPGGRLQPHEAPVVLQLSHLALEARLKERTVADLRAKLQQQSAVLEGTEERCRQLEQILRRMRLDAAMRGVPVAGGPTRSLAAAAPGA